MLSHRREVGNVIDEAAANGASIVTPEDVIRTHTQAFNEALKAQDLDALSRLYADDYMLVRPDGSVLSKEDVLRDLRDGGLIFRSIEMTDVIVRIHGATALLTAESRTVTARRGAQTDAHFRLVAVYVADGSGLRLVHFQSVTLPA
jgi:ketosteroid isomerase-like protein